MADMNHLYGRPQSANLRENRRAFFTRLLALASAAPLAGHLADTALAQTPAPGCTTVCPDTPGQTGVNCALAFKSPPEIARGSDGMLHAVLVVQGEHRPVPFVDIAKNRYDCQILTLRAYEGYKGKTMDPANRVTTPGKAAPGPTLRAEVGDTVQIALLNHMKATDFPDTSVNGCDFVKDVYPGAPPADKWPNCFRAANTTNLHFHGTHTTPDGFGDNVLVSVMPDPSSTAQQCEPFFKECLEHLQPTAVPHGAAFRTFQGNLKSKVYPKLARTDKALVEKDKQLVDNGHWPTYWQGFYPNCFTLPKYTPGGKYVMGQSPGTHWYHPHQHGATTIHVLNGLAGAFVIEDNSPTGYDGKLKAVMPGVVQHVLVLQQFQDQPNLLGNAAGGAKVGPSLNVNGQLQPVITMRPGEVQWWRIVNATVQASDINQLSFVDAGIQKAAVAAARAARVRFTIPANRGSGIPTFRQIAQDGIQFDYQNYVKLQSQPLVALAPANRVDILVKAPDTPGESVFAFGAPAATPLKPNQRPADLANVVARVRTVAAGNEPYNKKWPETKEEFPVLPEYLSDITSFTDQKTLTFAQPGNSATSPAAFTIDKKAFNDERVDQSVLLGTVAEWTIVNTDGAAAHPFHIHINPFQITEVFDPATMTAPLPLPQPWVWWDTFALPKNANGKDGYIKIRHRFVDFPGYFVLHCHILAHEDRGMMQLVQVTDNKTLLSHGAVHKH